LKRSRKMLKVVAGMIITIAAAAGAGHAVDAPASPATGCNQTVQIS
jgi:hypothetical protein